MNFFINRPIFAVAIALMMVLAGIISMLVLPIAQYPPLVPPQIQVQTRYIGASADVVTKTLTTPQEEQLNGSEGMIYLSSNSTNSGNRRIVALCNCCHGNEDERKGKQIGRVFDRSRVTLTTGLDRLTTLHCSSLPRG